MKSKENMDDTGIEKLKKKDNFLYGKEWAQK